MANCFISCLFIFLCTCSYLNAQSLDSLSAKELAKVAQTQQNAGKYMISNENFRKAAAVFEAATLWEDYFNSQNQIARNYWKMHKLDSSEAVGQAILDSKALPQSSLQHAEALSNVGVVYDMRSSYGKALKHFHQALDIRLAILGTDHFETGKIYYNIGVCYSYQSKSNTALEYMEKALRNFKKNLGPQHPFLITVIEGMRDPLADLGREKEAIELLKEAIAIAKKVYPPNHPNVADIYYNLGLTQFEILEYRNEGLKNMTFAFEMKEKHLGKDNPKLVLTLTNFAISYRKLKDFEKARDFLDQAETLALKSFGTKHMRTYYVYRELRNFYEDRNDSLAAVYGHKSMLALLPTVSDNIPIDSIPDFENIPVISVNQLVNAYFKKAFVLDGLIAAQPTAFNKKLYYKHLQHADNVIDFASRNVDNLEDHIENLDWVYRYVVRKTWFYRNISTYNSDNTLKGEIFSGLDQSKSLLLKASLSSSKARDFGGLPDSLREQEVDLNKKIKQAEFMIFKAQKSKNKQKEDYAANMLFEKKEALKALKVRFEEEYPQYFKLKHEKKIVELKEVQDQLLDEETMLVEYLLNPEFLYVFSVTKDSIDIDFFRINKDFYDKIRNFRGLLSNMATIRSSPNNGVEKYSRTAIFLYEKLLKKYLKPQIKKLILIPDRHLNRIPFEALLTQASQEKGTNFRNLSYLFKSYDIRYAYSAGLLLEAQYQHDNSKSESNKILGFAAAYNPKKGKDAIRRQLVALPGAIKEVENLEANFYGDFFIGTTATEQNFKAVNFSEYGVLHLAMHGLLDKKNPINSSMAFTQDSMESEEDDYVYAHELTNMRIPTNLVVLSACETGDGKNEQVEGIMSIGRSFMYAGVPSILMTLWQVNDFSTSVIVTHFYEQLAAGKTKSEALGAAKKHYLSIVEKDKKSDLLSHPFFWAAFISLGDNSNIPIARKTSSMPYVWGGVGLVLLLGMGLFVRNRRKEL